MLNDNMRRLSKRELDLVSGGFAGCPVGWGGPVTNPGPLPTPPRLPIFPPIFPPRLPIFPPLPLPVPELPTGMPWL